MGMGFAPTWLRQVSPPLLHKTTLTTDQDLASPRGPSCSDAYGRYARNVNSLHWTTRGVNLVQNVGTSCAGGLGTEVPQWGPGAKPQ